MIQLIQYYLHDISCDVCTVDSKENVYNTLLSADLRAPLGADETDWIWDVVAIEDVIEEEIDNDGITDMLPYEKCIHTYMRRSFIGYTIFL